MAYLCIQTKAFSWPSSTSSPCALICVCSTDGSDLQGIHSHAWIVDLQLAKPGVNHVKDPVHCERSLSDVGSNNALASAICRFLENFCLKLRVNVCLQRNIASTWVVGVYDSKLLSKLRVRNLQVTRQLRINWKNGKRRHVIAQLLHTLCHHKASGFYVFLPSHKH